MQTVRIKTNYGQRLHPSNKLKPNRKYFLFYEGIVTEYEYFTGISNYKKALNIKHTIEIFNLKRNQSQAPRTNILTMINDIKERQRQKIYSDPFSKFNILDDDRIWIIFDRDTVPIKHIKSAMALINQTKNYFLAFTNPCFELWLLLHFEDVSTLDMKTQGLLLTNKKVSNQYKFCGQRVKSFNEKSLFKSKHISFQCFLPHISTAIKNEDKIETTIRNFNNKLTSNIGSLLKEMKK